MSTAFEILQRSLGPAPSGWTEQRLGDVVDLVNGFPFPSESFSPAGELPLVRIRDLTATDFETYLSGPAPKRVILQDGDVVIGMDGEFNVVRWNRGPAALNQRLCALRPRGNVGIRFVEYWLPSLLRVLNDLAYSTTVKHLSSGEILAERVLLPEPAEQRRIADFLDDQVSRLNRVAELSRGQQRSLEERQQALVESSVVGLNEPGDRRQSSVGWIDAVPGDWSVEPIGRQFEMQLGKMLAPDRVSGEYERPYLRNSNVQWDRIDTSYLLTMNFPPVEQARYRVEPGDLLVCEGGDIGRAAIWDGSIAEIYYQKALHRVRPRSETSVRWLYYVLRAATRLGVFTAEGGLSTIAHLTGEQLRAHRVPIPPPDLERRLIAEMDERATAATQLVDALTQRLTLLEERKQALITAAVTGQFDVTTARAVA